MVKDCFINSKKTDAIYFGVGKSNCLTHIPEDINLDLDPLNATVVGSPTVNNGVVSGFSSAKYIKTNPAQFTSVTATASSWEMVFKFTYKKGTEYQNIWCQGAAYASKLIVGASANVCLNINNSRTSTNVANINGANNSLTDGSTYWVKAEFTGSAYNLYLSTDGINYNRQGSASSTTKMTNAGTNTIGVNIGDGTNYKEFKGSIDLSQSYIKVNGSIWWQGGTGQITLKAGSKVYVPNGNSELKYYKYTGTSWTQPKMTSNTLAVTEGNIVITATSGSSGGTKNYPYQAMDGNKSGNSFWEVGVKPSWWQIKFPYRLRILGVKYYKANNDDNNTTSVAFYTSSNKGQQIGSTLSTSGNAWAGFSVSNIPSRGIITDTLYLELLTSTGGFTSIGELEIQAEKITGEAESTADDYDYVIPQGTPIFDEVIVKSDVSVQQPYNDTRMLFIRHNSDTDKYIDGYPVSQCHSGSTAPTGKQWMFWYDTSSNILKRTSDSGATWDNYYSFPICIYTNDKGGISSIDQVFNGFGYIGSTSFILPNVKGLIPNGFNEDVTYKSIEKTTSKVLLKTVNDNAHVAMITNLSDVNEHTRWLPDSTQDYTSPDKYSRYYNIVRNVVRFYNGTEWTDQTDFMKVANIVCSNGKITSLTPREVQYNNQVLEVKRVYKGSQLIWGYDPTEVIFQSSTPGTYTVDIATSGYYNVAVVGAGSGGAYVYSSKFSDGRASGGSGAGFVGIVYLTAGKHTIKVGAGGSGQAYESNGQSSATSTAGGQSAIDSIIVANGGGSAKAGIHGASQTAGSGGTLSYDSSKVQSYSLATNGNAGTTAYNSNITGGASVYGGYGKGGNAGNSYTTSGSNGYVLISAV